MTIPLELIEADCWPSVRQKIADERARRIESLLYATPDVLVGEQQFIAALDWVVDLAKPKAEENEDPIYD